MIVSEILAQRYMKRYLLARVVSNFGNGMSPIALAFGVLHLRGGSATELGWILALAPIAMMAMAPFGGVIADKYGRVRVVGICDIWGSVGLFVQAAFFATGHVPVWVLLFANINFGLSWGVFWPASSGVMPAICKDEALQRANSLQYLVSNTAMILGAALGGIIVSTWGSTTGLFIDAATFTFAGSVVFSFRHLVAPNQEPSTLREDLIHGWKTFISYKWAAVVIGGFSVMMATWAMTENILGPLISLKNFHGAKSWAIVLTAESIGYLVGSLIGIKIKLRFPLRAVAILISTLALFSWSMSKPSSLVVIAIAAFIWGVALDLLSTLWSTTLARSVPREALSRVSSYDALGSFLLRPIGLLIAAPLANHFGYTKTLIAIGVVSLLVGLLMLAVPQVRNMELSEINK